MPNRVEAEGPEAKRFLAALRGILKVPKSEIDAKVARSKGRKSKRERQNKEVSRTSKAKG